MTTLMIKQLKLESSIIGLSVSRAIYLLFLTLFSFRSRADYREMMMMKATNQSNMALSIRLVILPFRLEIKAIGRQQDFLSLFRA